MPTRFSLVATPLTRAMAAAPQNAGELEPWRQSLDDAVATGELYSQAVPITPPDRCNDIGQVYGGPVVAVVDANTYSAGDLFAAGFSTTSSARSVTVGEATGAGGANVWMPERRERRAARHARSSSRCCRRASATRISVRRATRSGDVRRRGHRGRRRAGPPELRHDPARPHGNNGDLRAICGRLLAAQPRTAWS